MHFSLETGHEAIITLNLVVYDNAEVSNDKLFEEFDSIFIHCSGLDLNQLEFKTTVSTYQVNSETFENKIVYTNNFVIYLKIDQQSLKLCSIYSFLVLKYLNIFK